MEKKNVKALGIACSLIGSVVALYGKIKYNSADSMYGTASYFGKNKTSDIWEGYMSNYKTVLIVGLIILLIGIILLISSFMMKDKDVSISAVDSKASTKLIDLQNMLNSGLITQEEFEENKKRILQSM